MGNKRMGPPEDFVDELRLRLAATVFVETGTYLGQTTAWAAQRFSEVITIEASPDFHAHAVRRFAGCPGVRVLLGDSRVLLERVVAQLNGHAVFWLDAHWSGGATAGEQAECPLLAELAAIDGAPHVHAVLVDDARCFLAPPPRPHRAEHWPELPEVVAALASGGRRYVTVLDDVLIAVPAELRGAMREPLQDRTTAEWMRLARSSRLRRWLRNRL